jgi:hypothetical protein
MPGKVLALGVDPKFVDPAAVGGASPELVRAYLDAELERVRAAGFEVDTCLVDSGATAEAVLQRALAARDVDCVLIGAGLRAEPSLLLLFEKLLNVVHAAAPGAKICFNSSPADSTAAVRRWLAA